MLLNTFPTALGSVIIISSAVYTGIKKPESFSHSGFFVESCYATSPKHCQKNPNRKTHLRSVFLARKEHARKNREFHTGFLPSGAHERLALNLRPVHVYSGFWSRAAVRVTFSGRSPVPRDQKRDVIPARLERACTLVKGTREISRMDQLPKHQVCGCGFFAHAAFRGMFRVFLAVVNGTTKNPNARKIWILVFAKCKWALVCETDLFKFWEAPC